MTKLLTEKQRGNAYEFDDDCRQTRPHHHPYEGASDYAYPDFFNDVQLHFPIPILSLTFAR